VFAVVSIFANLNCAKTENPEMELQTDVSGLAKKSPDTEETFYLPGVFEVKFLKTY
jgi:hypothetical protein